MLYYRINFIFTLYVSFIKHHFIMYKVIRSGVTLSITTSVYDRTSVGDVYVDYVQIP